jgi:hypothetical protein
MAGTGKNVIFASRSSGDSSQKNPHYVEAPASVALTPGEIVVINPSGEFALNAVGDNELVYVVNTNSIKQLGVSDAWSIGDTVVAMLPRDGEKYNVRLAVGQTLVVGTPLTGAADGQLAVGVAGTDEILMYSDEIVASTTAGQLVRALKA